MVHLPSTKNGNSYQHPLEEEVYDVECIIAGYQCWDQAFWPQLCVSAQALSGVQGSTEVLCRRKQKPATKYDPHLTLNCCFEAKRRSDAVFPLY